MMLKLSYNQSPIIEKMEQQLQYRPQQCPGIPLKSILSEFYAQSLGLDRLSIVMHDFLDNSVSFSNNTVEDYYHISRITDKVFNLENIATSNKKFSELYCAMVQRVAAGYDNEEAKSAFSDLTKQIKALDNQLADVNLSGAKKKLAQKRKTRLEEQFEKLNYTQSVISQAKTYCDTPDESKPSLDYVFMKVKAKSIESYVPKVIFKINISNFPLKKWSFCKAFREAANTGGAILAGSIPFFIKSLWHFLFLDYVFSKIYLAISTLTGMLPFSFCKNENVTVDINLLKEQSDYFQSYELDAPDGNTQKTGKAIVAFKSIARVPVEFPWMDSKIYQISTGDKISLNAEDTCSNESSESCVAFSDFAEYCRIPKKIIIGVGPAIIYSEIAKDLNQNAENPITQGKEQYCTPIPDDSVVVLGYELDSSLCDSPLVGAFKAYDVV